MEGRRSRDDSRMLAAEIHVEFDAPARLVVQFDETVFDDKRLRDHVVPPVVQEEPLLNQEVWRDGVEMKRNGRDDRAHRAVRRDEAVEGFRDGGDFDAFHKTMAMRKIRLDNGDGAGLQQTAELLFERQPFASRDRNVHTGRNTGHAFFVFRLDRLFEEKQIQIFKSVADLDGEIAVVAAMTVEQQRRIDCWTQYWTDERKESVKSLIAKAGQKRGIKAEMFQPFFDMINADYQPASIYEAEALPNGLISSLVEKVGDSYMVFTQVKAPAENVARNNDLLTQLPHTVVVDPFYYTGNMVKLLNDDFNLVLGISSLFVFVVLLLSFRRLLLAAIAFLPMAMSWYITLGVMGLFGLQFNLINIVISTFIFGIGVDYSIFIMDGLINRARGNKSNLLMFHKTAIVFSAFVLIVGIASLIFATHPAIASIGFATLVGMTSTVVIAYTVQPFLFNMLMRTKIGKKIVEKA